MLKLRSLTCALLSIALSACSAHNGAMNTASPNADQNLVPPRDPKPPPPPPDSANPTPPPPPPKPTVLTN